MKNILTKISALVLVALMVVGMSTVAFAATQITSGAVDLRGGGGVLTDTSEIAVVKKSIKAYNPAASTVGSPTITYTYSIASGSASKNIKDSDSVTATTKAGVTPASVTITASENNGAGHYNELVWAPVGVTTTDLTTSSSGTLNTKTINFDFSSIVFGAPGVYRYVVSESASAAVAAGQYGTTGVDAGNNAQTEDLFLDVYVRKGASYTDGSTAADWDVYGFALFQQNNNLDATNSSGSEPDVAAAVKVEGFTDDEYHTYDVNISKTLENDPTAITNQFPFSLDFAGTVTGVLPKISNTGTATIPSTWTAAGAIDTAFDVAIGATLKIANGGTVSIVGIPVGTTLTVKEQNNVAGTTYTVNTTGGTANISDEILAPTATTTGSATTDGTEATFDIGFTNTFAEISPTGVVLRVAPYAMVLGFGFLFIILFARRRSDEEEDEVLPERR